VADPHVAGEETTVRKILFHRDFISDYSASPVADVLGDFERWLREAGYYDPYVRRHIGYVRHALERQVPLSDDRRFDADDLTRMFKSPVRPGGFAAARWAFEQYLRARERWIATEPTGPHEPLLASYVAYLRDLQGLAAATITQRDRVVRLFLAFTCRQPKELLELTPPEVERFVARRARQLGRSALQSTIGHLRSFLRFCQERALCPAGLDMIDRPYRYRDERPPRAIPWKLAQRLLASIDRSTRMGCRDYTMFYLMTHFGLRPGEVCALRLADVDLKGHLLRVPQAKVNATLTLPLSTAAVRVLARYLRDARPRTTRPELFLSVLAPLGPMTRMAIAAAFQRHVHRSGLPLLGHSPYGLRHGFAMRLLGRGVGIKAIGDLLGHRTLESTSVYLRLNTEALREVALPVPARSRSLHEGRVS
jgi:site-specific recombinase XerD